MSTPEPPAKPLTQFLTGDASGTSVTVTLNDAGDWLYTGRRPDGTTEVFDLPRADEHDGHGITPEQMRGVAVKMLRRLRDDETAPDLRVDLVKQIADDMEADAKAFDGKAFTGEVVAEYLGNQAAAIAALANVVATLLPAGGGR